jgi:outer membrane protein assembly factor BamB
MAVVMRRTALLTVLLSLMFAASAEAATLTLSKVSSPPLTTIAASGTGFAPGERVDLRFDSFVEATPTADSQGRFANEPVVVPDVAPGVHQITATGRSSRRIGVTRILVRTPWPMYHGSPSHIGVNFFERTLGVNEIGGLHLACAGSSPPATAAYSSPAIWSGLAIIGTTDGRVLAFDTSACNLRWSAPTGSVVYSSPAVAGGRVIVGTLDRGVQAFDARTGAPRWSNPLPGTFLGSATPSGGLVYIGNLEGTLYALDLATGAVRWSSSLPAGGAISGAPAVVDGRVFAGYSTGRLRAFKARTGKLLWTVRDMGPVLGAPAVHDGVVFAGGGGNLYAIEAATGKQVWAVPAGPAPVASSAAVANGFVFVRTRDRTLRGFDELSGVELIAQQMGGDDPEAGNAIAYASPVVANGVLYVTSSDARLYAFDANDGAFLNSVSTRGEVWGSPAVADGRVWVGVVNTLVLVSGFAGSPREGP